MSVKNYEKFTIKGCCSQVGTIFTGNGNKRIIQKTVVWIYTQ